MTITERCLVIIVKLMILEIRRKIKPSWHTHDRTLQELEGYEDLLPNEHD